MHRQESIFLFGNLPNELWRLIIFYAANNFSLLNLITTSKTFYNLVQDIMHDQTVKPNFNCFVTRIKPQLFFSANLTSMTALNHTFIATGNNEGCFRLYAGYHQLVAERKVDGGSWPWTIDSIISIINLSNNSWLTLSDQGVMRILQLNENNQLIKIGESKLEAKKFKQDWVAVLDNGIIAILSQVNSDNLSIFQAHFVSIENNQITTKCILGPQQINVIDKIQAVGNAIYMTVLYIIDPGRPRDHSLITSIVSCCRVSVENGFELSATGMWIDQYRPSIVSSSLGRITLTNSQNFIASIALISRYCYEEKKNKVFLYTYHLRKGHSSSIDIIHCHNLCETSLHKTTSYIHLLPNNYLLARQNEALVIYHFEFKEKDYVKMIDVHSFKPRYSIKIPAEKQENLSICSVISTEKGDVLIHCHDAIYQWRLSGNELAINNNLSIDTQFSTLKRLSF